MWKRTLTEKVRGYFGLITRGRFRKSTNSSAEFADTLYIPNLAWSKEYVRLRCHCHSNLKMSKLRQKIV